MSLKNWLIKCELLSPLAGDAPNIEALLMDEVAVRSGVKCGTKLTRGTRLSEVEQVGIPVSKISIGGQDLFKCSDPIYSDVLHETVDRLSKRFDSSKMASIITPEHRKALLVASGPYKSRFAPIRVRHLRYIAWFVRGDKCEINRILKKVYAVGKYRNIGYGFVKEWTYKEIEIDKSIIIEHKGKKILMKTIPAQNDIPNLTAYTKSFGSCKPPFWHPENYCEVFKPC